MLKTETRTIGGFSVTATQLPCMRGLALLPKLHLMDNFALATGGELQTFVRELLSGVTIQKQGARIDLIGDEAIHAALGGDVKALLDVVRFAMEVNNFLATSTEGAPGDRPAQEAG